MILLSVHTELTGKELGIDMPFPLFTDLDISILHVDTKQILGIEHESTVQHTGIIYAMAQN